MSTARAPHEHSMSTARAQHENTASSRGCRLTLVICASVRRSHLSKVPFGISDDLVEYVRNFLLHLR